MAKLHNLVVDDIHGDNLFTFPIEKARLRSIIYPIVAVLPATIGYGWSLNFKAVSHLSL